MPFYEYYCKKCDKIYEFFQKITDNSKTTCEVCRGDLRKQISLSSFHLKGSGWYVTDYAKGNGQGAPPVENKDPDKKSDGKKGDKKLEKSKTNTKSESKSETKAAAS